MREWLARIGAVVLGAAVVTVAALFAHRQNVEPSPAPTVELLPSAVENPPVDPEIAARGRALFDELGCARCHAAEGRGNPRSPLDGIGGRRPLESIRARTVAAPEVADELPRSAVRAKQPFGALSEEELDALTAYLSSLR
jgi:mono/diheme cytochrome c family protein